MKRKLGISVYPEQSTFEEDKQYLDLARSLNYEILFTSILHFYGDKDFDQKVEKVFKVLKYAKSIGFYTVLDVEQNSMNKANIDNEFLVCKQLGIDCIRLDTPLKSSEIAAATHNIGEVDIQINMSNNDNLITNIIDYKPILPRLNGCHNFYPLKYTGLPYDFFEQSNKKFIVNKLETSAFVASHFGEMTTAVGWKELPTLEMQRNLAIKQQAKILFYSNQIDNVLIGNAYATKEELIELAMVEKYEIEFEIEKISDLHQSEIDVIKYTKHYRRQDITEYFIRSSMTREICKEKLIKPKRTKITFNYGDIVVINDNDMKYKGELLIILVDEFENTDKKYNYVGKIAEEELFLLKFVGSSSRFRFKFIKE